jgi:signal transduction histidine kinase
LFVIQGRDQGRRVELSEPTIGIGRDSTNTIKLHDTEISRRHAEIHINETGCQWIDLGSSNGSFINSSRVDRHLLRSGDRVQVGRTLMIFTGSPQTAELKTDAVGIVGQPGGQDRSHIIKSFSHEEGNRLLSDFDPAAGPWLARVRSNLQIMYRTALAVSHTMDIDQLLARILDLIFEWVEADRGCILLVDQETRELVPKVRRDRQNATSGNKLEISQTILDYVLERQEGVLTSNARQDERWDPTASIVKLGVREAICVPMQGRYDTVGIIYIDTFTDPGRFIQQPAKNKFSEEHLKLMVAIGHQAALAVEDTSYYSAMLQAERLAAVGQTIAMLSHHIKNILQGIRGGSYLIEEGLKVNDPEVTRKGWRIVEKNQDRISALVMDMLTFSKDRQPEMVSSSLNEVVEDVLELMQTRAEEARVHLTRELDESIGIMMFDPEGIHRAVLNIVTNAIDACEVDGTVHVATLFDREKQCLRVIVRDNGVGIEPANLKKIFTVFESGKGSRGTGLGLPVSKKIIQEHSGDIEVESEVGQGTTFRVEIPAVSSTGDTERIATA